MNRIQLLALLTSSLALSGSCRSGDGSAHPRSALQAYVQSIQRDDPKAAYALLSKKQRSRISFEAFSRAWGKNRPELKIQAAAIQGALKDEKAYDVRARLKLKKSRTVTLAWEPERWHILGGVGSGFAADSPLAAVKALVRAVEARNFSAFMHLLSKPRREKLLREISLRLEKLKANLDRDFEITGNRARLQYDPQYWILLVKEKDIWRIVDFN